MKSNRTEFWLATVCFLLFFFCQLYQGLSDYGFVINRQNADPQILLEFLLPKLVLIVSCYGAFLITNFHVIPVLWNTGKFFPAIAAIIVVYGVTGIIFMIAESYLSSWIYKQYSNEFVANMKFLSRGFTRATIAFFLYGIYSLARRIIVFQHKLHAEKQTLNSHVTREAVALVAAWLGGLLLLLSLNRGALMHNVGPFYLIVLPFCFALYLLNLYWLIPGYKRRGQHAGWHYSIRLLALLGGLGFIEITLLAQSAIIFSLAGYVVFYWLVPAAITVGLSWRLYLVNEEKYERLTALRSALGTSHASLQFLRSQINPHFLFNALNTLYATALIEKADRTSEGIQKLGDMMRFMLHENTHDLIPLSRDIEYLRNYIDLQNLRISETEDVNIKVAIPDDYTPLQIAPMLLIPFIENAYKHGISFQEPSYIHVNLEVEGQELRLDVHNSLHPGLNQQQERTRSGIGLENVNQRLQLLYPGKHELQIRQTRSDYFIHLTIYLS